MIQRQATEYSLRHHDVDTRIVEVAIQHPKTRIAFLVRAAQLSWVETRAKYLTEMVKGRGQGCCYWQAVAVVVRLANGSEIHLVRDDEVYKLHGRRYDAVVLPHNMPVPLAQWAKSLTHMSLTPAIVWYGEEG